MYGCLKKRISLSVLLVFALILIFSFSGCNQIKGTVTTAQTVIDLNNDGSGVRTITCPIDVAYIESNVIGGKTATDEIIQQNCPQGLTCELSDTGYIFKLEFSSIEDYKSKVESISGTAPQITLGLPNSVFASGIKFSESFSSASLLEWLNNKMYDSEVLKQGTPLWNYAGSTVNCNGQSYQVSDNASVLSITYKPTEKIAMNTTALNGGKYARSVEYYIPSQTYNELKDSVESFMQTLVPEGAKSSWNDTSTGKVFKIELEASGLEDLSTKTQKCMNNNVSSIISENGDNGIFSSNKIKESVNLTSFPSNESGATFFEYTFNFDTNSTEKKAYINNGESKNDVTSQIVDNKLTLLQEVDTFSVELDTIEKYAIGSAEIAVWQSEDNSFAESLDIKFEDEQQLGATRLQEYVNSKAPDSALTQVSDNRCIISIYGDIQSINSTNSKLFVGENRLTVDKSNGLSIFNTISAVQKIDFSEFFRQLYYENEYDFYFSTFYDVKNVSGELNSDVISSSNYELVDSKTIKLKLNADSKVSLSVESSQINYLFLIIVIVSGLIIIVVICALIFYIISKKKDKEYIKLLSEDEEDTVSEDDNEQSTAEDTDEQSEVEKEIEENNEDDTIAEENEEFKKTGHKCKNCGSDLYEGMQFCISCGKPVEDSEE